MSGLYLTISRLERHLSSGGREELTFEPGVNLLVGRPNTGKTKWLQTLDFLLGDPGDNPFEGAEETGLADKYDSAAAQMNVGGVEAHVERRWREKGAKSKVFVDGEAMAASEFQHWLLERLGIPLLHFPKGNPMSGQTWPELSFRMLLRHIYRQQRFWGGIADQQPDGEQHACLLQFLGLAERVYTDEYGELIQLRMKAERLQARREQYGQTLNELGRDVLSEPGMSVGVTPASTKAALDRLAAEVGALRSRRIEVLTRGSEARIAPQHRGHLAQLGQRRADTLVQLEEQRRRLKATAERLSEMRRYRGDLSNELDRIDRADDAGAILADLRITHCPACDQPAPVREMDRDHCFLCQQHLPGGVILELGSARLRFERDRITGEIEEADQLSEFLDRERKELIGRIASAEDELQTIEQELEPARQAVSALVQEEVSAIDVALGKASERERQVGRLAAALDLGVSLEEQIRQLEKQIEPLHVRVEALLRATDFEVAADRLENGMTDYLNKLNLYRPGVWRHSRVSVDITRSGFTFRVGGRRWSQALGGTDTLYFLMSYHYGLLTLSNKDGCHYPGLAIVDLPGDFLGEDIEDKENFIVQPFIDLLSQTDYEGVQLMITGASFSGFEGAHVQRLTHVHVA